MLPVKNSYEVRSAILSSLDIYKTHILYIGKEKVILNFCRNYRKCTSTTLLKYPIIFSNSSNNCIRSSEDYHLTCLWLSGFHVSSRLRTISSLTRKLSLSNSRILINGGDRDRDRDSPQQCGEYLHLQPCRETIAQ